MYSPSSVPMDTPDGLKRWLADELRHIAAALNSGRTVFIAPSGREPVRPRDGLIAYADGVSWNPGSGAGFYGYEAGAWIKL